MVERQLEHRHMSEKEFHDKKFSGGKKTSYYDLGFSRPIFDRMMNMVGAIQNKHVLEYGCGSGWFTKELAGMGAEVWSFDISEEAVKKTISVIEEAHFQDRVHVSRMPGEKLAYDSDMFDVVIGLAVLHHLDLEASIREIKRVLKKGGKAYFMEPLGHNIFLNIYRRMTPHLRSKDETPMLVQQFEIIKNYFSKVDHEEYYLTTIAALIWHFIGANSLMIKNRDALIKLDGIILKYIPALRKYCWYSILEIEK